MMRSIISFKKPNDLEAALDSIAAAVSGHIVSYTTFDGVMVQVTINHHDGPTCPNCGKEIHLYGHGLCRECWSVVKRRLDLKS